MNNQIADVNLNNERKNDNFNSKKSRKLLYGVIAISAFILTAVGATFAFFAANANSGDNSIQTSSSSIKLTLFSYESAWMKNELIPVRENVVRYSFENQDDTTLSAGDDQCFDSGDNEVDCDDPNVDESKTKLVFNGHYNNTVCVDDYGNNICSIYVFQVFNNNASPQTMSFSIISDYNSFSNLYAGVYRVLVDDSDLAAYNSSDNNNKIGDPISFNVKRSDENGVNDADAGEYTPLYVNRGGLTKQLLTYNGNGAIGRGIMRTEEGIESTLENVGMRTSQLANNVEIGSNSTATFAVIIYIANLDQAQVEDEDKEFRGSISVTTGDGTGVSGYIGAVSNGG